MAVALQLPWCADGGGLVVSEALSSWLGSRAAAFRFVNSSLNSLSLSTFVFLIQLATPFIFLTGQSVLFNAQQ